jgi:hypothetical protein
MSIPIPTFHYTLIKIPPEKTKEKSTYLNSTTLLLSLSLKNPSI